MKLSKDFDSNEFKCKCCGQLPEGGMNPELIELLQAIRDKIGKPILITSGYRCEKYNRQVYMFPPNKQDDNNLIIIRK